jgi:hypothetical protein
MVRLRVTFWPSSFQALADDVSEPMPEADARHYGERIVRDGVWITEGGRTFLVPPDRVREVSIEAAE